MADNPITRDQQNHLRHWLASIRELDDRLRSDVLERCRQDTDCRSYFLRQARTAAVENKLRDDPGLERAYEVDADLDPVAVTVAIRGVGVCDLAVPRDRWNPFLFLTYLEEGVQ